MTLKPSPKVLARKPDRPQGAQTAPIIHANIKIQTGLALGVIDLTMSQTIWKTAVRMPPMRNAPGKTSGVLLASKCGVCQPAMVMMKPNRMQTTAPTTLNQMTSHKPAQTDLPMVAPLE